MYLYQIENGYVSIRVVDTLNRMGYIKRVCVCVCVCVSVCVRVRARERDKERKREIERGKQERKS